MLKVSDGSIKINSEFHIDASWPVLYTQNAKWAEKPPKIMKQSRR